MQIGILECGPTLPEIAARYGTYPDMFARLFAGRGWSFAAWAVKDMDFPPSATAADGWLLTGSRFGTYEDHAFIPPLEDLIRAAFAARRPLLGICFGHQLIAQAMGGRVEKAAAGWGIGRQVYDVDGVGPVAMTAWHQDQVTRVPDGAEVVARNDFCPVAALRYDDLALSVQAHPEFGRDVTAAFLALQRDEQSYPPDLLAAARDRLDTPLDTVRIVDWLAEFMETAHARHARPTAPTDRNRRHG